MGCCCVKPISETAPPSEGVKYFWPVSQGYVKRSNSVVTRKLGRGILYVSANGTTLFYLTKCCGKRRFRVNIPLNCEFEIGTYNVNRAEVTNAFSDSMVYIKPCYCSESRCGDGILNLRGVINGDETVHMGFFMPNSGSVKNQLAELIRKHT